MLFDPVYRRRTFAFYKRYSYSAGDGMLGNWRRCLQHLLPGPLSARAGVGDEVLVLLPATTREGAFVVAERLRSEVEATSKLWMIPITISIGISTYPAHGSTIQELLLSVEKAAKYSKEHGKNQITAFDDTSAVSAELQS